MKKTLFIFITLLTFAFILQNCGGKKVEENKEEGKDSTNKEEETAKEEENPDAELEQDIKEYAEILCALNEASTTVEEATNDAKKEEAEKTLKAKETERDEFDKKMEKKYGSLQENQELQEKVIEMLKDELLKMCDVDISTFLGGENGEEESNPEPPVVETETPSDEEF